jgi:phage shock protein E
MLIVGLAMVSCSTKKEESAEAVNKSLQPAEFKSKMEIVADAVVLDVRTPEEVEQGTIAGATSIDFKGADFEQQVGALDKDKTYFVYCAGGGRSSKAADLMKDKGFTRVYSLEGGITAWKDMGFEVSTP